MEPASYCLFETAIGTCGIAWRETAGTGSPPIVTHFQLPETSAQQTESRIARNSGSSQTSIPPAQIAALIEKVRLHLQGNVQDFRDVPVDLDSVPPFFRRVYEVAVEIPAGQTRTYGEIAKALGQPSAAQEVGQALARNPVPLIVPCHRVLAADGKLGGFSAPGGLATKTKLLSLEGAPVTPPLFP
jgi:methylated-DNA-[protein]-cysteine S-methyltransferase